MAEKESSKRYAWGVVDTSELTLRPAPCESVYYDFAAAMQAAGVMIRDNGVERVEIGPARERRDGCWYIDTSLGEDMIVSVDARGLDLDAVEIEPPETTGVRLLKSAFGASR
jgi:hypothetical protein